MGLNVPHKFQNMELSLILITLLVLTPTLFLGQIFTAVKEGNIVGDGGTLSGIPSLTSTLMAGMMSSFRISWQPGSNCLGITSLHPLIFQPIVPATSIQPLTLGYS
jgi:hypothetical protein